MNWKTTGAALALIATPFAASAQSVSPPVAPPAFSRVIMNRVDAGKWGANLEVVQGKAEFGPGAESGAHIHPGLETIYVVSGEIEVSKDGDGGKPLRLKAGEGTIIPRGVAHNARNIGSTPAQVASSWIVEKGAPMVTKKDIKP
jgi:quercetin dioxygenase-like cupin family protein